MRYLLASLDNYTVNLNQIYPDIFQAFFLLQAFGCEYKQLFKIAIKEINMHS